MGIDAADVIVRSFQVLVGNSVLLVYAATGSLENAMAAQK